jgi:phosphate starvation-inducible PhoH-like protein
MSALQLISDKRVSDLIYLRSVVESSEKSMGYLPGSEGEKLAPYVQPLMDKLEELLPKSEIELLIKEQRVQGHPINFLRGLSWNAKAIVMDESQNMTYKELFTLITRVGEFSKLFILGDPQQSDIKNSGFVKMMDCLSDEESRNNGVFTFKFTEDDIVRSQLVKFIIKKLKNLS